MACCGRGRIASPSPIKPAINVNGCPEGRVRVKYTGPTRYLILPSTGRSYGVRATDSIFCVFEGEESEDFFEVQ